MSIVEKAIEKLQRAVPEPARPASVAAAASAAAPVAPVVPLAPPSPPPASRSQGMLHLEVERLRQSGLLPPASEERRLAGEFRQIKRPLVARALANDTAGQVADSVIMIASALPGDGKTFTAFNLCFSLSLEQDATVLLVDADLPKPHISGVLGIDEAPGLLDALADPARDVESLIFETDRPNLQVLGAGTRTENATELLASQRMTVLIEQMRRAQPRRIIVFDSPPLLLTTESRELGSAAGQVVLVVRAGVTPRQAVLDAIALLGEGKRIGIVLNQVDAAVGDTSYYGYGKYGGYGSARTRAE
jgi:exopolysaccharide/PEP-CTERM locus tyrosine autokinase